MGFSIKFDGPLILRQRRSQNAEKSYTYQRETTVSSMTLYNYVPFQIGTSLNGKNLLPEGAKFLVVWEITFTTSCELPWMLLFLLLTCILRNGSYANVEGSQVII